MRIPHLAAIPLLLCLSQATLACSCFPQSWYLNRESFARDRVQRADVVVHARVTELLDAHTANIEIIERIKGPADISLIKAQGGAGSTCGTQFQLGEEHLFLFSGDTVSLCGKLPPDPHLIESLRKYRD